MVVAVVASRPPSTNAYVHIGLRADDNNAYVHIGLQADATALIHSMTHVFSSPRPPAGADRLDKTRERTDGERASERARCVYARRRACMCVCESEKV